MRSCLGIALTMVLGVAGCHRSTGEVHLDLTSLTISAAQSNVPLAGAELRIEGPNLGAPIVRSVSVDDLTFDVQVPAGPRRVFTVEAWAAASSASPAAVAFPGPPVFWGVRQVDIAQAESVELDVVVVPAGGVSGSLVIPPDIIPPPELFMAFQRETQVLDLPRTLRAPVIDNAFGRALPVGRYTVVIDVDPADVAGTDELPVPIAFEVVQGQITSGIVVGDDPGTSPAVCDNDLDGWSCDIDCDDNNPSIFPGAPEQCNTLDDNCDAIADNVDNDYDGFIASSCGGTDCDDNNGQIVPVDIDGDGLSGCDTTPDCEERSSASFPGSLEICDGFDNDCNGLVDDIVGGSDNDADGVNDCVDTCIGVSNPPSNLPEPSAIRINWLAVDCGQPDSYSVYLNDVLLQNVSLSNQSCNCTSTVQTVVLPNAVFDFSSWQGDGADKVRVVRPAGAQDDLVWVFVEIAFSDSKLDMLGCVYDRLGGNCNANSMCYQGACTQCPQELEFRSGPQQQIDEDGDGWGKECDCDDTNASITPVFEICANSVDDDCDGFIDEDCPNSCDPAVYDVDQDGFFADISPECVPASAWVDCDDNLPNVNSGIVDEMGADCSDGVDNDCDGIKDAEEPSCRGLACPTLLDLGGVLVASPYDSVKGGVDPCAGTVSAANLGGCTNSAVPLWVQLRLVDPDQRGDRVEICNESAASLEVTEASSCSEVACLMKLAPGECGSFTQSGDAVRFLVFRSAEVSCEPSPFSIRYIDNEFQSPGPGGLNDWDGDGIDDAQDTCVDRDGDGYGVTSTGNITCSNGEAVDCNDLNPAAYPGASETCDYIDNDCNGEIDENLPTVDILSESMETDPVSRGWSVQVLRGNTDVGQFGTSRSGPGGGPVVFATQMLGTAGNNGSSEFDGEVVITTPQLALTNASTVGIAFDSYTYNEAGCRQGGSDAEWVEITDASNAWVPLGACDLYGLNRAFDGTVRRLGYNLTAWAAGRADARVRFHFDTRDKVSVQNDDGWYIDNVRIYSCEP